MACNAPAGRCDGVPTNAPLAPADSAGYAMPHYQARALRLGVVTFLMLALAACGGGGGGAGRTPGTSRAEASGTAAQGPNWVTGAIVQQVGGQGCTEGGLPVTFGQPFGKGDVAAGNTIQAYLGDQALPTQTNIRARNDDGSARHAVITVRVPCAAVRSSAASLALAVHPATPAASGALQPGDLLNYGFDARVVLNQGGTTWTLDASDLLNRVAQAGGCAAAGTLCRPWLSGPLVSAWVIGGPLVNSSGNPHPHLAAYLAIRAYGPDVRRARVDVIVENNWTYVDDPHNVTYDATITVGNQVVYEIDSLDHTHHARWHKAFWWGDPGMLYAALDSDYLQASRAVPQYQDVQPTEGFLSSLRQECAPMDHCDQMAYMPATGGSRGIGPLSQWTAVYVVDTDYRAYRWMLANADALASYSMHYRDQDSGGPVSIQEYPCIRTSGRQDATYCPATDAPIKAVPDCKSNCDTPLTADNAHHPVPAYVAYLVTGDWYYMSELQFWANHQLLAMNQGYRGYAAGLINRWQLRGQAWALRTLGYAAYILPQRAPLKDYLNQAVSNNIQWYNAHYPNNPDANQLGIMDNDLAYDDGTAMASWQQSFFMWSVGNLADLGFPGASRLRDWLAPYYIEVMTSAPDFCMELASAYKLKIRDSQSSPIYPSVGAVYRESFPNLQGKPCHSEQLNAAIQQHLDNSANFNYPPGTMVGYPAVPRGYPSRFQIGLAAAVDSGLPGAAQAWEAFSLRNTQPDYSNNPKFALLPRSTGE